MKKIFAILLSAAAFAAVSMSAAAQQAEITAAAPVGQPGQGYTLCVYKSEITDSAEDILHMDEAVMTGSSELKFTFDFSESSGKYPYVITSDAKNWEERGELIFTNEQELAEALQQLKAAASAENAGSKVKECFDKNVNIFALDKDFAIDEKIKPLAAAKTYTRIAEQIDKIFAATDDASLDEIRRVYQIEMLLCGIEYGSESIIVSIDSNYAELLGLDTEEITEIYAGFSAAARSDAAGIEKGAYETAEAYETAHNDAVALAAINASASWLGMGEIIDKLNTVCSLGFPSLSATNRSTVLTALAEQKPFKSKADFQTAVSKQVAGLSSTTGGGSHASVSTGGGKGSSVTYEGAGGAPNGNAQTSQSGAAFDDLDSAAWARTAIEYLAKKGIVSGRGNRMFAPGDYVTREEFVTIIVGAFSIYSDDAPEFADVAAEAWYAPYVKRAAGANIVYGVGNNAFGVGTYITREDACTMIARAAGIDETDESASARFADAGEISAYAAGAVAALAQSGAVSGTPEGSFLPKNPITRAETAQIIYNYVKEAN